MLCEINFEEVRICETAILSQKFREIDFITKEFYSRFIRQ